LIAYEEKSKVTERKAEDKRIARYNYDRTRYTETAQFLDAQVKDLIADAKTLTTKVVELQADTETWKKTIEDKKEQQSLTNNACTDSITGLEKNVGSYNENLDLIRQVIVIFESADIQDIKHVVEFVNKWVSRY